MEPVYLLFWATMALLGGFLAAYIARWEAGMGLAVVAAIVATGLGLAIPLGGSWQVAFLAVALTVGLVCGAWREDASRREYERRMVAAVREYWAQRGRLSVTR